MLRAPQPGGAGKERSLEYDPHKAQKITRQVGGREERKGRKQARKAQVSI